MKGIDISKSDATILEHCNACGRIINQLVQKGVECLDSIDESPCFYKADDFEKYLLQCVFEAYTDKHKFYIKPIIRSDGKYDHYNNIYEGDYALESFLLDGDSDVLLVNGEAGIGKSSFMRELYLSTSLYSLNNNGTILPLFFQGEDYGSDNMKPAEWINMTLDNKYKYLEFSPAFFNPNVCVVFFIDAINDIQFTDYADFSRKLYLWQNYIENVLGRYKNAKVVISSRYLECLTNFEIRNYTRLFIQPFNDKQVSKFLEVSGLTEERRQTIMKLIKANDELGFLRIPFFLNKILLSSGEKLENKTEVINAFINFLFKKNTPFIRDRKEVYTEFGQRIVDVRLNGTTFLKAIEELAYNCQNTGTLEFDDTVVIKLVHEDKSFFMDIAISNGIFTKSGSKFSHVIFQEYFAGRRIATFLPDKYGISDLLVFDSQVHLKQALKHVYNLIGSKERFISILLDASRYEIAGECVLENRDNEMKRTVANAITQSLKGRMISHESNRLGLLLGRLGDIRFPIYDQNYYEPPTEYVESVRLYVGKYPITNREYMYFVKDGGYKDEKYWNPPSDAWFNREKKIQSICSFWDEIQEKLNKSKESFFDFCLSHEFDKELIANLVYFKAISKEDLENMVRYLYRDEKDAVPLMWGNPVYSNPSQPVVGISWFEAFAYCNWLSAKTNKKYRLLTSEEWEKTANSRRRVYVYGNRFNKELSNTMESGMKTITAVGICSENCTQDGIYDLSGNIFEWTSSIYHETEKGPLYTQYICKGGSWIQDKERATSRYVGRGMAWVRNLDLGFRVCADES